MTKSPRRGGERLPEPVRGPNKQPKNRPDSGIWHVNAKLTRSPQFRRISRDPRAQCYPHINNHTLNRYNPHLRPRAKAASPASRSNARAHRRSCGANSVSGSARRAPLLLRARSMATVDRAMWTCLIDVKWRMRIVDVTARGVSGTGRMTVMTAIAGIAETLGLSLHLLMYYCALMASYGSSLARKLANWLSSMSALSSYNYSPSGVDNYWHRIT